MMKNKMKIWLGWLLVASTLLSACATSPDISRTLRFRGKHVDDVFPRVGYPDASLRCVKDNVIRHVHIYNRRIVETRQGYVGTDGDTNYYQNYQVHVGDTQTYVFTDADEIVTSIQDATGFGNLAKELGCHEYREDLKVPSVEELSKRKMQPRVWKAIAMNEKDDQTIYVSRQYKTENEAVADALQKCQRGSGSKCEVWHRFSNMCLGMATGMKNGKLTHFVGITPSERMANDAGLVRCVQRGGTQCSQFKPAVCAVPCNILPGDKGNNQCMYDLPLFGSYGHNGGKVGSAEFTKFPQ